MTLVVDTSVTMAWIFADERDAYSLAAARRVDAQGGAVPALWRWEVENTLLSALRRNRIDEAELEQHLLDLQSLPIEVDGTSGFGSEVSLARQFDLSVYDAAYLELAMRRNCKLATNDEALRKAARSSGVYFSLGSRK